MEKTTSYKVYSIVYGKDQCIITIQLLPSGLIRDIQVNKMAGPAAQLKAFIVQRIREIEDEEAKVADLESLVGTTQVI